MLEKPALEDAKIIDCLRDDYGLTVSRIEFLPLGADVNTAVYRVDAEAAYFAKLRRGSFDETTVAVPRLLYDQGLPHIIAPLTTRAQALWASLDEFTLTVSPFVEGQDGYTRDLSEAQWVEFGRALMGIHRAALPDVIKKRVPQEDFGPQWRDKVKQFQAQVETDTFGDPMAAELAEFLNQKHDEVITLVRRAEALGAVLQSQTVDCVLCHADIHAGNVLLTADDRLYIVDWDTLLVAPKERDLMFVGGGLFGGWRGPEQEERLFYQGYSPTQIDPVALAYYRYERIVEDIAAYCQEILLTATGGEDRANGLRQLTSQFRPGAVVEMAYRTEHLLPPEYQAL